MVLVLTVGESVPNYGGAFMEAAESVSRVGLGGSFLDLHRRAELGEEASEGDRNGQIGDHRVEVSAALEEAGVE
jgi:hypothetical protein